MKKKIKMLKPGTFKSMSGKVVNLTSEHLTATAAAYDPAIYACPMVIGHPTVDSPSYGKITTMDFSAPFLNGEPGQIAPGFVEAVNKGYYDHVSLSLFEPDSPSNPVPGVYYPRHLGFLGAAAPAVPGLGTVSFAAEEQGVVSFSIPSCGVDFGSYADTVLVRVLRNLKNTLIGEWGKEKADAALDEWDLQMLTEEAARPDPPAEISTEPAFAEHSKGGPMKLTQEQIDAKELALTQREKNLQLQENARIHDGNLSFAESLVADGKRPASQKAAIVAALDFAAGITEGDTIEFGEGDAKKTQAPLDIIKSLLGSGPKIIEFGELVTGEDPGTKKTSLDASKILNCV